MAWFLFCIAYIVVGVTMELPGFLVLRCARLPRPVSLCLAPGISVLLLTILGVAYAALGIGATWVTTVLLPSAILLALNILIASKDKSTRNKQTRNAGDWMLIGLYVAVGILLTVIFFAGSLDGPASFQPDNDNAWHLGLIRSFAEQESISPLSASLYGRGDAQPASGIGFYPAVLHGVAALAMQVTGLAPSACENAVVAFCISIVYPLGSFVFISAPTRGDRKAAAIGSVACLSVVAFPWRFVTWGPLYPNLVSLAMIPGAVGSFILATDPKSRAASRSSRAKIATVFAFTLLGIALAHPNGCFTAGVLIAPYMCWALWSHLSIASIGKNHTNLNMPARIFIVAALALLIAGIWYAMFRMPALHSVVSFRWQAYQSFQQGFVAALTFMFERQPFFQPILTALIAVGTVFIVIRHRRFAWILFAYFFTVLQYAVCTSQEGFAKHLLCGFWYTDHNRIAANVALASVPVILFGCLAIAALVAYILQNRAKRTRYAIATAVATLPLIVNFTPAVDDATGQRTSFVDYQILSTDKYSALTPKSFNLDEQRFIQRVQETIPPTSTVINIPSDGSCFAYALDGLNLYYRDVSLAKGDSKTETKDSKIIRSRLVEYSSDHAVQKAVKDIDARYVLLLDQGAIDDASTEVLPPYAWSVWRGIGAITESTPGFKLLLSEGDMRLYEIIRMD